VVMQIITESLTHIYGYGEPDEVVAVRDVSLTIGDGEFVGLIGPTGSGKSTLIQHFNGLLKPTQGRVIVGGTDVATSRDSLVRRLRQRVGLVFQYPEHQFFEDTVFSEVAFGPRNMSLLENEVKDRVLWALGVVGLDSSRLLTRSPFQLSGGQRRRLAIASVLSMRPEMLILDEPTAGLDPIGKRQIMDSIARLHSAEGISVMVVSHDMDMLSRYVKRVVALCKGEVVADGEVRRVLGRAELLRKFGLDVPEVVSLVYKLREKGIMLDPGILTVTEAKQGILAYLGRVANG
jgi:energy-coupling factor transport system ATP-binding protein